MGSTPGSDPALLAWVSRKAGKKAPTIDRSFLSEELSDRADFGLVATFYADGGLEELTYRVGGRVIGSRLWLADGEAVGKGTFPLGAGESTPDSEAYRDGRVEQFNAWSDNSRGSPQDFVTWVRGWIERIESTKRAQDALPPIFRAARGGSAEDIRESAREGDIEETLPNRNTPAIEAAFAGNVEATEALIDLGANINHLVIRPNPYNTDELLKGHTALSAAAEAGHPEVVRALLDAGADPHMLIEDDGIALLRAARSGSLACVQHLLEAGSDPRHMDRYRRSALHRTPSVDVARALLDAGIPVDYSKNGSSTPFSTAMDRNVFDVARFLLERGADPDGELRRKRSKLWTEYSDEAKVILAGYEDYFFRS